ncbi:MAG: SLBB domain-containing protein, partial [Chitinispirillaceae bacterium]|nr:SLBB domain-containing protein [Chitinispirillaceae bacterium]
DVYKRQLYKLIYELGKPIEEKSFEKRADLLRLTDDKVTYTTIPVDLKLLKENPSSYPEPLKPFDEVIVYEKDVEKPTDLLVTIEGEVRRPGFYSLTDNMSVVDVILRAGGFTREAYTKSVDVYRVKIDSDNRDTITEVFKIDLPEPLDFTKDNSIDFKLKDRDKIFVRRNPNYQEENYVKLEGYVRFKGKYALKKRDERLSDIIERAGGVLPDGFLEGAVVIRKNRRVVVDFKKALADVKSNENILLQKDDSIYIPKRPNTVLVSGNVNNPGYFSYVPKQRLKTYLEKAGGLGDSSDFILVKTPIGDSWKISRFSMKNPVIEEGAEIIVTKKKPRERTGEKSGPTIAEVIRDTLAIMASALTVIGLMVQLRK